MSASIFALLALLDNLTYSQKIPLSNALYTGTGLYSLFWFLNKTQCLRCK